MLAQRGVFAEEACKLAEEGRLIPHVVLNALEEFIVSMYYYDCENNGYSSSDRGRESQQRDVRNTAEWRGYLDRLASTGGDEIAEWMERHLPLVVCWVHTLLVFVTAAAVLMLLDNV